MSNVLFLITNSPHNPGSCGAVAQHAPDGLRGLGLHVDLLEAVDVLHRTRGAVLPSPHLVGALFVAPSAHPSLYAGQHKAYRVALPQTAEHAQRSALVDGRPCASGGVEALVSHHRRAGLVGQSCQQGDVWIGASVAWTNSSSSCMAPANHQKVGPCELMKA